MEEMRWCCNFWRQRWQPARHFILMVPKVNEKTPGVLLQRPNSLVPDAWGWGSFATLANVWFRNAMDTRRFFIRRVSLVYWAAWVFVVVVQMTGLQLCQNVSKWGALQLSSPWVRGFLHVASGVKVSSPHRAVTKTDHGPLWIASLAESNWGTSKLICGDIAPRQRSDSDGVSAMLFLSS